MGQDGRRIYEADKVMTDFPLVFVIVVNYNGEKYLRACLSSIESQTYQNCKTIVLDNASTDNSVDFIRQNFPNIIIIQSKRNLGFAEGNNFAIKIAIDQKARFIFLFNTDAELEKDVIDKLVNEAQSNELIGIVGPALFDIKNRQSLQEMGMAIDKFGYPMAIRNFPNKNCIFFVSGCALLIKSTLLKRIGFFDESYFMFGEDLDLCWRAWLAGYKTAVDENARVYHQSGGTISGGVIKGLNYKTNVERIYFREKNTLRTIIKNYETINMLKVVPFYISLLLIESIFWLLILKPNTSRKILEAITWNLKLISDTLHKRVLVQNLRKTSDAKLVAKMVRGYCKLSVYRAIGIPNFVDS